MGQKTVIKYADADGAKYKISQNNEDNSGPGEKIWENCKQSHSMKKCDAKYIHPVNGESAFFDYMTWELRNC